MKQIMLQRTFTSYMECLGLDKKLDLLINSLIKAPQSAHFYNVLYNCTNLHKSERNITN